MCSAIVWPLTPSRAAWDLELERRNRESLESHLLLAVCSIRRKVLFLRNRDREVDEHVTSILAPLEAVVEVPRRIDLRNPFKAMETIDLVRDIVLNMNESASVQENIKQLARARKELGKLCGVRLVQNAR